MKKRKTTMETRIVIGRESSAWWKMRSLRWLGAGVATRRVSTRFIHRGMSCRSTKQGVVTHLCLQLCLIVVRTNRGPTDRIQYQGKKTKKIKGSYECMDDELASCRSCAHLHGDELDSILFCDNLAHTYIGIGMLVWKVPR